MPEWTTACPDWAERLKKGQTIIPPPIYPEQAEIALSVFRQLKIVDAPGSPTFGEACAQWVFDLVAALFGSYDAETGRRHITEVFVLIPKKNSKSTLAAGIMMTALLLNWRQAAGYTIIAPTVEVATNAFNPARDMVTVPAREVIHDRFNCLFHPLIGLSPIYAAGLAAMQGHHIQENSAYFFRNGGKPSGVIEVPGSISEESAIKIKDIWDSGYSGENAGKTAILSNGAKYNPTTVSAADAQTVEQLSMTAQIICSVFHVPAYKVGVGELPTHDNIEAQDQQYYSQCLQSLIESIELLLDEAFDLEGETGTEFDVNALLRMDSERRIKSLGEGVKNTILTPNEARRSENLPPLPGGDALYLQQQNYSLEALARRDASEDPFAKSGASSGTAPGESGGKAMSESELTAAKAMLRGLLAK